MNKEQMIDLMKNGFLLRDDLSDAIGNRYYVSFGQWSKEMQELAKEIGIQEFQYMDFYGVFFNCYFQAFIDGNIFKLRPGYEFPKPEPAKGPEKGHDCCICGKDFRDYNHILCMEKLNIQLTACQKELAKTRNELFDCKKQLADAKGLIFGGLENDYKEKNKDQNRD